MRAKRCRTQLAVASLALLAACSENTPTPSDHTAEDRIEITYLANEGFLLAAGNHKVLIDGLFREGVDGYENLPLEEREKIETAQPPFDTVDVVLATHHHADHFHALAVCRFLDSNPLAEFVSTQQALDQMRSNCDNRAALAGRVRAGLRSDGSPAPFVLDELRFEAVFLHHGPASPVENIGFLIEIGGLTVLHMGDSQATVEELRAAGLGERTIDLAFVPFWYLIDKRWTPGVELLQPGGIVAMHIPPPGSPMLEDFQGWDGLERMIINRFPQSVVFAGPFETRMY